MKNNQKGSTLIISLIVLLATTILAIYSAKHSLFGLRISTNTQAKQLMIQSADSAVFNIEDTDTLLRNIARDGMFGYIRGPSNKGKELTFCFRGEQAQFFSLSKASIIHWNNGSKPNNSSLGVDGFCRASDTSKNHYTSGRKATMTQVSIKIAENNATPFQNSQRGTDEESAKIDETERVVVVSTAIMPTMTQVDPKKIDECLSERMQNPKVPEEVNASIGANSPYRVSASQCLEDLGVPHVTQVSEYNLIQALGHGASL